MANVTVSVPDDFKQEMDKHSWVNWSEVAREGIRKKIEEIDRLNKMLSKSEFTEEDVKRHTRNLKKRVAKRLKK